jgi:hypothetical protein
VKNVLGDLLSCRKTIKIRSPTPTRDKTRREKNKNARTNTTHNTRLKEEKKRNNGAIFQVTKTE